MKNVDDTLTDRGQHYGDFARTFDVIQQIKAALKDGAGWAEMPAERREALEMIAVKMGRLVSGDSGHADSWHDIAGYARLVEESVMPEDGVLELEPIKIDVQVNEDEYVRWLAGKLFWDADAGGPLSALCKCCC